MTVWRLEWATAAARRRRLGWNVAVPVLLLLPVALSGAAAAHRAAVYAIFFVFFGLFGGCVPLVREGRSGWIEKLLLTGTGARRWWAERLSAHTVLDLLQLAPVTLVLVAVEGGGASEVAMLAPALLAALLTANLLGGLVAATVRSLAEGALVCAAVGLGGLHLAGVFRAASPGSWARVAEWTSPFRPLIAGLGRLVRPAASGEPTAAAAGPLAGDVFELAPLGSVAALLLLGALTAPWVGTRLSRRPVD